MKPGVQPGSLKIPSVEKTAEKKERLSSSILVDLTPQSYIKMKKFLDIIYSWVSVMVK